MSQARLDSVQAGQLSASLRIKAASVLGNHKPFTEGAARARFAPASGLVEEEAQFYFHGSEKQVVTARTEFSSSSERHVQHHTKRPSAHCDSHPLGKRFKTQPLDVFTVLTCSEGATVFVLLFGWAATNEGHLTQDYFIVPSHFIGAFSFFGTGCESLVRQLS